MVQATGGRPKSQTLQYRNGYAVPLPLRKGEEEAMAAVANKFEEMWTVPAAQPGAPAGSAAPTFEPKYVALEKKVSSKCHLSAIAQAT